SGGGPILSTLPVCARQVRENVTTTAIAEALRMRVSLQRKGSHKRTALSMQFPVCVQTRATIGIRYRYRRHSMGGFGQRRIERNLIAAKMIAFVQRARMHGRETSCAKHCDSVLLVIDGKFRRRVNHLFNVSEQLSGHMLRKRLQRRALA